MRRNLGILAFCGLCVVAGSVTPAHSATLTIHATEALFLAAVGGPVFSQDFEGYAAGTNLSGVEFLPGVSVTTNMSDLEAFGGVADRRLFGSGGGRTGAARYDIALGPSRRALAFDIDAFESVPNDSTTAQSPGVVTVWFADATSQSFNVSGNAAGDPIFIGLTSDTDISVVWWAEALEGNNQFNEETALDNFRVAQRVPEPTTLLLVGAGLVSLLARRRS